MPPPLITISAAAPDPAAIDAAARQLTNGGLVVFPTETVYGLAADPDQPAALDALYEAKGRPADKPIALFAADVAQVRASGVAWPDMAEKLASRFWPGPLTLVLELRGEWIGYRIPDHPVPLALLRRLGRVLAVTSANRSGEPPVRDGVEAQRVFAGRNVLILDAGPVGGGQPSTVVRVGADAWSILRPGAISEAALRAVLHLT